VLEGQIKTEELVGEGGCKVVRGAMGTVSTTSQPPATNVMEQLDTRFELGDPPLVQLACATIDGASLNFSTKLHRRPSYTFGILAFWGPKWAVLDKPRQALTSVDDAEITPSPPREGSPPHQGLSMLVKACQGLPITGPKRFKIPNVDGIL
jgi:hypothetical protein